MATISMRSVIKTFEEIDDVMLEAALHSRNVLLKGERGVGKTSMVRAIAKTLELELKTYSIATLDPFVDLIGIAVPDIQKQILTYFREQGLLDAEFLFFDEMNRGHPRITNAILEIVQLKSLNGERLPNLKMAWGAINPSDRECYHTQDMDAALVDRFHYLIDVPNQISPKYFEEKYNANIAKVAFDWWNNLSDQPVGNNNALRNECSPRRLDYLLEAHRDGLNMKFHQPFGVTLPINILKKSLDQASINITLQDMIQNKEKYVDIAMNRSSNDEELNNVFSFLKSIEKPEDMFEVLDIVMSFKKKEYISTLIHRTEELNDLGVPCITESSIKKIIREKQGMAAVAVFNEKYLEILH